MAQPPPASLSLRPHHEAGRRTPRTDAERAKEREFYRYYHRSPKLHPDLPSFTAGSDDARQRPTSAPVPNLDGPEPSQDTALTAFAQLGALRLNTRRCLISFFDCQSCYILAEATRQSSIKSGQADRAEDRPVWGTTTFAKEKSLCAYTVGLPFHPLIHPDDPYANHPSLIVNDLTQDVRFSHYPFVVGAPYSRFYAGVPVRSPAGHSIGTYCVLDDKPRDGLSESDLNFLKDMAATVMRHLTLTRAFDDQKRGGVMVKSLGSFADGRATVDAWLDSWDCDVPATGTIQDPSESDAQMSRRHSSVPRPRISPAVREPVSLSRNNSMAFSVSSIASITEGFTPDAQHTSVASDSSLPTPESTVKGSTMGTAPSSRPPEAVDKVTLDVRTIFDRAAQMIVDATEAEGTVFFDAKINSWGGLVDDDIVAESLTPTDLDKPCAILGTAQFRHPHKPAPLPLQHMMSESALKRLLKHYPRGHIFHLYDDAIERPAAEADCAEPSLRKSVSSRSSDDESLLKEVFPQARSVVWYPLWDTHRDRWFASVAIWSSDPMRVFTAEQEMSYLAAFSNSAMAEVARLDTKLADAAKADFISSISHELRSPLHGILGMTDLLKDTQVDVQQLGHLETIETCGKTLLDTINHVLDFAKINTLTRGATKTSHPRPKTTDGMIVAGEGHNSNMMTIVTDVDMSVLAEEALESVFAGFNFQQSATHHPDDGGVLSAPPLAIIMDINKSDNYVFHTQPGAWRRVIMNIFGNALKYTIAGFIKIKLQISQGPKCGPDEAEFRLTIVDSGIGMSESYVNNSLYHSFAQENPLSQGTGLGLSIVKQLVDLLGGEIEVQSEKGRGTRFTVTCRMKTATSPQVPKASAENRIRKTKERTAGQSVCFLGFEETAEEAQVQSLKNKTATMMTRKTLERLCRDWFGMETWNGATADAPAPDLYLTTEAGMQRLRDMSDTISGPPQAPVVVLCRGGAFTRADVAAAAPGLTLDCITQPLGPHKLAKMLSASFARQDGQTSSKTARTDLAAVARLSASNLEENVTPIPTATAALVPQRPPIGVAMSAPIVPHVESLFQQDAIVEHPSLNCLAVDDNPINLRLLRTFVDKLGHKHVLAKNGLEAVDAYKASWKVVEADGTQPAKIERDLANHTARVDVVLMDIQMPIMDGLEATRQIRAFERDHHIPPTTIIALTGVANSEAQQEAHASGINLFLIKPVRLADLDVVLKGVVTNNEPAGSTTLVEE